MGRAWRRAVAAGAAVATAAALTVTATVSGALPAAAAVPSPSPASAADLRAQAERQARALADERTAQAAADTRAAAALEASQLAARQAGEARRVAAEQAAALRRAQQRTAVARERLARYLGSVYRSGVGDTRLTVLSDLIDSEDPQALFSGLSMASRVGANQGDQLVVLRRAQAEQDAAARRADEAEQRARATARAAEQARAAADAAVAQQRARVARAEAALAATRQAATSAAAREALLARAEAIARARAAAPLAAVEGALVPRPTAGCTGGDTTGYPNGRIPAAVLCALWGTSGQLLRADAAASFNALSRAYAARFGAPVCVTDSYRSYEEQVAVKAAKPTLAATPGTSNHGWGVALDLCDGIQSFGSPQHEWMRAHAMAYGWFHPAWAQAGGSKPEAWHWEYAG